MSRIALLLMAMTVTLTAAGPADQKAIRDARTAQNAAIASSDLDRVQRSGPTT
jgi:hypothetical protein